jgi:hypothetical protein
MATIVSLVCVGILVAAWAWGDVFWRWKYRSSPPDPAHVPEQGQRHLALVATSAPDRALGSFEKPGASRDTHPPGGRRALLEQLAAVEGAAVYDARGKRRGMFLGIVGDGSEVAIRHDGVFVWRRRVLPAAMVAAVRPDHGARGAVVLDTDDKRLAHSTAQTRRELDHANGAQAPAEDHVRSADEERVFEEELTSRLAPYVAARDSNDDHVIPSASNDESVERYLLFLPTPHGYHLVEQDGGAPAVLDDVSLPGDESAFFVIKVGRSPLAGDGRPCAYLEPR